MVRRKDRSNYVILMVLTYMVNIVVSGNIHIILLLEHLPLSWPIAMIEAYFCIGVVFGVYVMSGFFRRHSRRIRIIAALAWPVTLILGLGIGLFGWVPHLLYHLIGSICSRGIIEEEEEKPELKWRMSKAESKECLFPVGALFLSVSFFALIYYCVNMPGRPAGNINKEIIEDAFYIIIGSGWIAASLLCVVIYSVRTFMIADHSSRILMVILMGIFILVMGFSACIALPYLLESCDKNE